MKTTLAEWGNSLAVRIPRPVADAAKLRSGDALELDVEAPGSVTIRKTKHVLSLDQLVARITPQNRHSETDWGNPGGIEQW